MITQQLISPKSIVVVGGSDDPTKPGGSVLNNLLITKFPGKISVVNPKGENIQGCPTYKTVDEVEQVDCAIMAIPARFCPDAVETLCAKKGCKAFIILSAGFHEDGPEGSVFEEKIVNSVNKYGASLIGPNCIGVITANYAGVFTKPILNISPKGVDLISGSGATVVFIMETAMKLGLTFANVFSVGNSAQIGVEEVLEYLDTTYKPGESAPVKLMYIESINNPQLLLKHARSLISKGAKIVAVKAGYSEAGSKAATSHTGAMATPDTAVNALFKKAGIIRAYGRGELVNIAAILSYPAPSGKRIGIITHAGGPAVMLTDTLSSNGIEIPPISGEKADELLTKLYVGSSVHNPIDFLATGTAAQLETIIDYCNKYFKEIDAMPVIFGNPGLTDVTDVYEVILKKIKEGGKPIYPIFPSIINAEDSIKTFNEKGGIAFNDEVLFGNCLVKVLKNKVIPADEPMPAIDKQIIRNIVDSAENGYLHQIQAQKMLEAAGINVAKEAVVNTIDEAMEAIKQIGYPVVMKVIGPIHKSDVGGVVLNVSDDNTLALEFTRMMKIKETTAILLQPMLKGTEIFIGAKREKKFGAVIMCGLGGIFIEVMKDISSALAPVTKIEAEEMIKGLKSYKIIQGVRGKEGVNEPLFNEIIRRVSALCTIAPEIMEMDINPLLANSKTITAVDMRIRIDKDEIGK